MIDKSRFFKKSDKSINFICTRFVKSFCIQKYKNNLSNLIGSWVIDNSSSLPMKNYYTKTKISFSMKTIFIYVKSHCGSREQLIFSKKVTDWSIIDEMFKLNQNGGVWNNSCFCVKISQCLMMILFAQENEWMTRL